MQYAALKTQPLLAPPQIVHLRLAASELSGPKWQAFEVEKTLKYGVVSPFYMREPFLLGDADHDVWHQQEMKWELKRSKYDISINPVATS